MVGCASSLSPSLSVSALSLGALFPAVDVVGFSPGAGDWARLPDLGESSQFSPRDCNNGDFMAASAVGADSMVRNPIGSANDGCAGALSSSDSSLTLFRLVTLASGPP